MNCLPLLVVCWSCWVTSAKVYTNSWAVHVEGGQEAARELARLHGFIYVDEIMRDHYLLKHHGVSRRSIDSSDHHHNRLQQDPTVKWTEQQIIKRRTRRDVDQLSFNDPKWPQMWYLNRGAGMDMNVLPAYQLWNMTGKGIVVTILDDGIEKDHPDLVQNYDEGASYDVNGRDSDPQPRYDMSNENRHGTRCAGEVAAQANNNICGVGVAYEARIGGVRMLDGDVTDAVEAQSISLNPQHIDIYSASWGPDDDGRTVDGPGPLARKAFIDGIKNGRQGQGSIFVWASGNGGRFGDGCNCDGYTNSMYTLSISSATETGEVPWYSESCSSTLASTYSSGQGSDRQIITTDLRKGCTELHTGTSASAPLAAGICALALQANPRLTWRDMQHIVVFTAKRANLRADDWVLNGAGKNVSHHFGFGLMDASAMVELATTWKTVPEQRRCVIYANISERNIPVNGFVELDLDTDGCQGTSLDMLYLEHVESMLTISTSVRGKIHIYLTSPLGTRSTLLSVRPQDTSSEGFNEWPFMTTHNWGELPGGRWHLEVRNGDSIAVLKNWTLVLYGTAVHPVATMEGNNRYISVDTLCSAGEYYLRPYCYDQCPKHFYSVNKMTSNAIDNNETIYDFEKSICFSCHSTCIQCNGSRSDDCTSCGRHRLLNVDGECVDEVIPPKYVRVDKRRRFLLSLMVPIVSVLIIILLIVLMVKFHQRSVNKRTSLENLLLPETKRPTNFRSPFVVPKSNYGNQNNSNVWESNDENEEDSDENSSLINIQ